MAARNSIAGQPTTRSLTGNRRGPAGHKAESHASGTFRVMGHRVAAKGV